MHPMLGLIGQRQRPKQHELTDIYFTGGRSDMGYAIMLLIYIVVALLVGYFVFQETFEGTNNEKRD